MEDANEDRVTPEAATAEAEAESAEEEQKAARRGKVVAHTPVRKRDAKFFTCLRLLLFSLIIFHRIIEGLNLG